MKYAWLAALAFLAACGSPTDPAPRRSLPPRPVLAVDLTAPPAPTILSAVVDSIDAVGLAHITVTWLDNYAGADEDVTQGAFWDSVGTRGTFYAPAAAGTGVRVGSDGRAVPVGALRLSLATSRRVEMFPGGWLYISSVSSEPFDLVIEPPTIATTTRKGKKPR